MNERITREILWNVPVAFIALMYALLAVLLAAFVFAGVYWYRRVRLGSPEERFDQLARRTWLALRDALGQGYVVREAWGWMHYAFYVGFVGLFIGTCIVFVNSDVRYFAGLVGLPFYFYFGDFYLFFKVAMDTFFSVLVVGVVAAAARRAIAKPAVLEWAAGAENVSKSCSPNAVWRWITRRSGVGFNVTVPNWSSGCAVISSRPTNPGGSMRRIFE